LERAQRNHDQAIKNYGLKHERAEANMQEVSAQLTKANRRYEEMAGVLSQFTVYAPKAGMVIYKRGWDGKKQGVGSQVSTWDNVVATLPNLTQMISKTYVNEIDISKVKVNQAVEIGIEACPEKQSTGIVTEVANIGEQMKNSNAKVFEVLIEVKEFDSVMRPAMTTKNIIITSVFDSVVFIPIECVHTEDSISYVVKGNTRRQVIVGKTNENEIIIRHGLDEGNTIYLLPPEGYEEFRLVRLDDEILEEIAEEKRLAKEKIRLARQKTSQEEEEFQKDNKKGPEGQPPNKKPGGGKRKK